MVKSRLETHWTVLSFLTNKGLTKGGKGKLTVPMQQCLVDSIFDQVIAVLYLDVLHKVL